MENTKIPNKAFGAKGEQERVASYAEMLLSGKPMERRKSAQIENTPPLYAARKTRFGRRMDAPHAGRRAWWPERWAATSLTWSSAQAVFKQGLVWGLVAFLFTQVFALAFNVAVPTFGGRQLWTDIRVLDGWRVQCHAWTGHCRLLDGRDWRQAWGEESEMLTALDQAQKQGHVRPTRGHAVVLVHGLGRSAHSLDRIAAQLAAQGIEPVKFNYASTQGSITAHARALNRMLDGLTEVDTLSFVTHSLGGPVVRQALALRKPKVKLGRLVMLAPPNQGSGVARTLSAYAPLRWLLGPSLTDLTPAAMKTMPAPPMPFATVAGNIEGLPFAAGENDGLVSIAETKLADAAKHLVVSASHTFIMNHPDVLAFTTAFIGAAPPRGVKHTRR